MKTKGVSVVEGFLVLEPHLAVPVQFWNRLKHEIAKRTLVDEYLADFNREREAVKARRAGCVGWEGRDEDWTREERLFRQWVERLGYTVTLWPWERGWTEELVDSFLDAPAARAA